MREAEIVDAREDGKYGKGKRGSDLPEELQRRADRLEPPDLDSHIMKGRRWQRDREHPTHPQAGRDRGAP
jgi:hypothetical protein